MANIANWREIKEGQTIFKFDKDKEHQTLVVKFLSEGIVKDFNIEKVDGKTGRIVYTKGTSVEFRAEFKDKKGIFTTGSKRLIEALQNVADDLTGKRIKMEKVGLEMETFYTAKLIK